MNIAIISDFNIAGQPTALMRAINKYTDHKARCIIAYDDSFAYDQDILLNSEEGKQEAADWVKQCDFFHFGRGIFNWPGVDWNQDGLLNKNNCCIKYYGSELRNNWQNLKRWHEETGIAAITGTDWSITGRLLGSFYHLGSYFTKYGDMDEIPFSTPWKDDEKLKICASSAGSPLKGYDFLHQTIHELQQEGVPVELEILSQLSNQECLERKMKCHVTFTSLHGAWGISGIESMWMGHIIMSCLDSWILSHYPDNPTVVICRENLKQKIRELAGMDELMLAKKGVETRNFAFQHFKTTTILKRYLYLFDLIQNNEKYLDGCKNPEIIYDFF